MQGFPVAYNNQDPVQGWLKLQIISGFSSGFGLLQSTDNRIRVVLEDLKA